jgi:hypothetical protein
MKAKEYLDKNRIPRDARLGNNPSVYIRDLLEDYAKQEAIEFADYYFKNYRELINEFRADTGKAYQKFKDDES